MRARLLVNFPAGYASEKFGRRRMMSLGCGVLALASFAVVATSQIGAFFGCQEYLQRLGQLLCRAGRGTMHSLESRNAHGPGRAVVGIGDA